MCSVPKLFVRGTDNRIYENDFDPDVGSFTKWSEVFGDGLTLSAPAAVANEHGRFHFLKLFVRGLDNRLDENDFDSKAGNFKGWSSPEVLGNRLTLSAPAAVVHQGILKLL